MAAKIWGTPIQQQGQPVNGVPPHTASLWSTYKLVARPAGYPFIGSPDSVECVDTPASSIA